MEFILSTFKCVIGILSCFIILIIFVRIYMKIIESLDLFGFLREFFLKLFRKSEVK
jgi:hypothetical protein